MVWGEGMSPRKAYISKPFLQLRSQIKNSKPNTFKVPNSSSGFALWYSCPKTNVQFSLTFFAKSRHYWCFHVITLDRRFIWRMIVDLIVFVPATESVTAFVCVNFAFLWLHLLALDLCECAHVFFHFLVMFGCYQWLLCVFMWLGVISDPTNALKWSYQCLFKTEIGVISHMYHKK